MNMVNANDRLANIAQIVQRCPTITLRRAFVRALRQWCQETRWLRTAISGATTVDTRVYSLGTDPYMDIVGVFAVQGSLTTGGNTQEWALRVSDPSQWDPNIPAAQPMRYAYVAEGQFAVDPVPDQVYQLLVSAIVQPKEDAVNIPEAPLLKHSNEIEAGALAYLLNIPGQKWTNPALAQTWSRVFRSGISNGKAEVQRAFNNGSVRARSRNFVR